MGYNGAAQGCDESLDAETEFLGPGLLGNNYCKKLGEKS